MQRTFHMEAWWDNGKAFKGWLHAVVRHQWRQLFRICARMMLADCKDFQLPILQMSRVVALVLGVCIGNDFYISLNLFFSLHEDLWLRISLLDLGLSCSIHIMVTLLSNEWQQWCHHRREIWCRGTHKVNVVLGFIAVILYSVYRPITLLQGLIGDAKTSEISGTPRKRTPAPVVLQLLLCLGSSCLSLFFELILTVPLKTAET